jgi:chaperone required for assembly of F1-ATPase
MKRFYREAAVVPQEGGFGVALDGKPIRTPAKRVLIVPTRAIAEAVASEWHGQGPTIRRDAMRLTRLACTALDRVESQRAALFAELLGYAGTDLLCYRAGEPASLVARQAAAWDPLLAWAAARFGARLVVTQGIRPIEQPAESLARLEVALAALDPFRLAALHLGAGASGSLVIALALVEGRLDAVEAFAAAQIDEGFQIERWGRDAEFEARRGLLRADLEAAGQAVRGLGAAG